MMFGQSLGAYLTVARRGVERLTSAAETCLDVPMGGAVGSTSLGVSAGYLGRFTRGCTRRLACRCASTTTSSTSTRTGTGSSTSPRSSRRWPAGLIKMAKDLRLLASGNRAGFGEITIPPRYRPDRRSDQAKSIR